MFSYQPGVSMVEQVARVLFSALSVVCFVAMVAVAVHFVSHPEGPLEAHRFYHRNLTNFVDPVVKTSVARTGRSFEYRFTIGNGTWGIQDIQEISLPIDAANGVRNTSAKASDWSVSRVKTGVGAYGLLWSANPNVRDDAGIDRGETRSGFVVKSSGLPVIMAAYAGHDLHFDGWRGLSSDVMSPAGRRVTRWVIGPRDPASNISPHALLGSLVPGVHRAGELGWIRDRDLAVAIRRTLTAGATEIKLGEIDKALARLERLVDIAEANAGVQLSDEAYALVVYNVKHVIQSIRPTGMDFVRSDRATQSSEPTTARQRPLSGDDVIYSAWGGTRRIR